MDYEQMSNNKVQLSGVVVTKPVFSHEILGENFYEGELKVKRLSSSEDIIPFTISDRLMTEFNVDLGSELNIIGQFRSYNKLVDNKNKLMLTVFVREITEVEETDINIIELTGYICKQPVYRTTPFKREICDILLAVNRQYNKSDYIPCIAWGRNARYAKSFEVGDKINILGRIQSRVYQKQVGDEMVERVAYEVSINRILVEENNEVAVDSDDDYMV